MAALAISLHDRSARTPALRPVIFLLVLSLHAALLLEASHWQARLQLRSVASLTLLALPSHERVAAETGAEPVVTHEQLEFPLEIQLVTVPMPELALPAEPPSAPSVDWNAEVALTAKHQAQLATAPKPRALDQNGADLYIIGGPGFIPEKPEFGWDHARTHRVEALEGGGSMLWLNDRCFIVVTGLIPFPICGVGKTTARGDLFDQLHEPTPESRSNIAP